MSCSVCLNETLVGARFPWRRLPRERHGIALSIVMPSDEVNPSFSGQNAILLTGVPVTDQPKPNGDPDLKACPEVQVQWRTCASSLILS